MARWDDILLENSRLLLHHAETIAQERLFSELHAVDCDFSVVADDEGHDMKIQLHRRWHFPRALRWWTHRGGAMNMAG